MKRLILYPLLVLFICAIFYQLVNAQDMDFTYNETQTIGETTGNQTLNGSTSELTQEVKSGFFNVNMVSGFIALIIGLVALGVIAGVSILGSGLSDFSVKLIYNSSTYYGVWAIFSVLSFGFFLAIPIFGVVCWFFLTAVYTLGFFETLQGG